MKTVKAINLKDKLGLFSEHWSQKIIAEVDDYDVKLAKFEGEFVWHAHDDADEMFLVLAGELVMAFRDHAKEREWDEVIREGEMIVVPKGVEHKPIAARECSVLVLEKKGVDNTGGVADDRKHDPVWI